jgi:hypothetical protein
MQFDQLSQRHNARAMLPAVRRTTYAYDCNGYLTSTTQNNQVTASYQDD